MANIDVINLENKKTGSVDLAAEIFEKPVKKSLLHEVVKWQLASRRQGTHKAKQRGEVSGGGAKPFKQKGTGNARQGSSRSPLLESGAVIFGPRPRSYAYSLPKKVRQAGLKMALSYLKKENKVTVVDEFASAEGKTKALFIQLQALGLKKALLVGAGNDAIFARATRNLKSFKYLPVEGLNVYDLLKYDHVILSQNAIDKIYDRLGVGK